MCLTEQKIILVLSLKLITKYRLILTLTMEDLNGGVRIIANENLKIVMYKDGQSFDYKFDKY